MNLSLYIAKRYLISKKSHNIINIISLISLTGVMVGTMALIIVLSVFNGFETLVKSLFNTFDPDLKISLVEGKVFSTEDINTSAIEALPGVKGLTWVFEESALLKYQNRQALVTLKGLSENFEKISILDTMIIRGELLLQNNDLNYIVLGYGVALTLGINLNDYLNPVMVYAPRRGSAARFTPDQAFNTRSLFPSGIFSIQQDFDTKYALVPLRFAREVFEHPDAITAIEIILHPNARAERIKQEVRTIAGSGFYVKDRYEQQELLYKIMRSEKLAIYLILGFILFIATFNIIGTLSMLILDKRKDIAVLHSLGADEKLIRRIFFVEGLLISVFGAFLGMLLGALICQVQIVFGIVPLHAGGGSFVIDSYPVELQWIDFLYVSILVLAISLPAVWYPVRQINKKYLK